MSERKEPRIIAAIGAAIHVDGKWIAGMTSNINSTGMFFRTESSVPEGASVTVKIIHEAFKLTTGARVASVASDGVGIEFVHPPSEFREGVQRLVGTLVGEASAGVEMDAVSWSPIPAGFHPFNFWRMRRRKVGVSNLSLEGASFEAKTPPTVEDEILIYLDEPGEELHCRARVVRLTERGFAVEFLNPKRPFRMAVSRIRKAVRG